MTGDVVRKGFGILVVVAALALAGGCQLHVVSGHRCNTTDWGSDGQYALQCVKGRWVRRLTNAQVGQVFAALHQKQLQAADQQNGQSPSQAPAADASALPVVEVTTPTVPEGEPVHLHVDGVCPAQADGYGYESEESSSDGPLGLRRSIPDISPATHLLMAGVHYVTVYCRADSTRIWSSIVSYILTAPSPESVTCGAMSGDTTFTPALTDQAVANRGVMTADLTGCVSASGETLTGHLSGFVDGDQTLAGLSSTSPVVFVLPCAYIEWSDGTNSSIHPSLGNVAGSTVLAFSAYAGRFPGSNEAVPATYSWTTGPATTTVNFSTSASFKVGS